MPSPIIVVSYQDRKSGFEKSDESPGLSYASISFPTAGIGLLIGIHFLINAVGVGRPTFAVERRPTCESIHRHNMMAPLPETKEIM